MTDSKLSLSERLKAERHEQKDSTSLADRMKEKRKEAEEKASSLADRMKEKRGESKSASLAERMKQNMADTGADAKSSTSGTLMSISEQIQSKIGDTVEAMDEMVLDETVTAELKATLDAQRTQFESLISRVKLTDIVRDVTQTGDKIMALPERIGKVRQQGYIYRSYLEDKVDVLATQWDGIQSKIDHWIEREADQLADELDATEKLFHRIDADPSITMSDKKDSLRAGSFMEILEAKVEAAEAQIQALFGSLQRETNNTVSQLAAIEKILAWREDASFDFAGGENIFLAAKAEWDDGGEKPDGILYITDQRLIFEQKEKVGKKLGMFGGKEVQEVLWEAPMTLLERVESENKGLMGGKDMLTLSFGSGAPYGTITVELKDGVDNTYWEAQIKRMLRNELESDSIAPPDDEFMERLSKTPTDCPTCGATLPQVSGKPQQIECGYCGTAIRI